LLSAVFHNRAFPFEMPLNVSISDNDAMLVVDTSANELRSTELPPPICSVVFAAFQLNDCV
jgi:hypothetical protein